MSVATGTAAVVVDSVTPAHEQAEAKRADATEPGVHAALAYAGRRKGATVISAMSGRIVVVLLPDVMVVVVAAGYTVISWKLEQSVLMRDEGRAKPSTVPVKARAQLSFVYVS
jgi:hypothetical protein